MAPDALRSLSVRDKTTLIRIGDTKSQVLTALGQPTVAVPVTVNMSLGFPQPVVWCYGRKFRWHFAFSRQFPYFVNVEDRSWSFYPWPRDTVVEFDRAGKVLRVQAPTP